MRALSLLLAVGLLVACGSSDASSSSSSSSGASGSSGGSGTDGGNDGPQGTAVWQAVPGAPGRLTTLRGSGNTLYATYSTVDAAGGVATLVGDTWSVIYNSVDNAVAIGAPRVAVSVARDGSLWTAGAFCAFRLENGQAVDLFARGYPPAGQIPTAVLGVSKTEAYAMDSLGIRPFDVRDNVYYGPSGDRCSSTRAGIAVRDGFIYLSCENLGLVRTAAPLSSSQPWTVVLPGRVSSPFYDVGGATLVSLGMGLVVNVGNLTEAPAPVGDARFLGAFAGTKPDAFFTLVGQEHPTGGSLLGNGRTLAYRGPGGLVSLQDETGIPSGSFVDLAALESGVVYGLGADGVLYKRASAPVPDAPRLGPGARSAKLTIGTDVFDVTSIRATRAMAIGQGMNEAPRETHLFLLAKPRSAAATQPVSIDIDIDDGAEGRGPMSLALDDVRVVDETGNRRLLASSVQTVVRSGKSGTLELAITDGRLFRENDNQSYVPFTLSVTTPVVP
jgi:hypothetical protein